MKSQFMILIAACSMSPTFALAGEPVKEGPTTQNILFEDLKMACTNPARYHNQVAPSNIQISCSEMKTKWVADPQGSVNLPIKRQVITSVITSKYTVSPVVAEVAADPQAAGCYSYKEVMESVESVHTANL